MRAIHDCVTLAGVPTVGYSCSKPKDKPSNETFSPQFYGPKNLDSVHVYILYTLFFCDYDT